MKTTSLRTELVRRLAALGIEDRPLPGRDDGFSCLHYRGKEFAHFHSDGELDLRLGRTLIKREGLSHPPDSKRHPKRSKQSPWIEIRFTDVAQLKRVIQLVEMAIADV